jgi:lipoprotein-anchoring transpeptidase ErfK/SrfK
MSKTGTIALRTATIAGAVLLFVAAAAAAWLIADDYMRRTLVPAEVSVGDLDVSAMDVDAARTEVEEAVANPLLEPVTVMFRDSEFTLDPKESLSVDTDGMLTAAMAPRTQTLITERVYRYWAEDPIDTDVEPMLDVDGTPLTEWVEEVASKVDTEPVNASVELVDGKVVVTPSAVGYATDRDAAAEAVNEALLEGRKVIELPTQEIQPEITEDGLGAWIMVDLSERKTYLYDGTDVEKKYGIAIGTPRHPTPRGSWKITAKRYMPTWRNPGSAWAANMPDYIGPGVSNPLGTRALNLDASGIRFHGTTQNWSIGRAASHGCMRMHRWDVEDLYERVEVGTKVFIVS